MDVKILERKVAIIMGADYRIGQTVAELFAEEGASVVLIAREKKKLEKTVEGIRKKGGKAVGIVVDTCFEKDARKIMRETRKIFGTLDILVNNTADTIGQKMINEALKIFMPKNQGTIINIFMEKKHSCYGSANILIKNVLGTLTKNVAMKLMDTDIQCNAVTSKVSVTSEHLAHFPEPECEAIDQAYACLYLASKMGKAVRGEVLQIHNGTFL